MKKDVALIRVFVSSPESLAADRQLVAEAAEELNRTSLLDRGTRFAVFSWQTAACPDFGPDSQAVLNRQLTEFDVYVGLMGHEFGSPTARAGSGMEEEFNLAYERWKEDNRSCGIMFYFNEMPVALSSIDPDQLRKVKEFRSRLGELGGLHWTYNGTSGDLPKYVRQHFLQVARAYGMDWGPSRNDLGASGERGTAPDGERGQLDYAVDAEESFLSATRSLGIISAAIEQMGREVRPAVLRVTTLKQSGALNASAAREGARAVSSAVSAMAGRVGSELPSMVQAWTAFRGDVMLALGMVPAPETQGERDELRLEAARLDSAWPALQLMQASVAALRVELAKLASFSQDLRGAVRTAETALTAFGAEIDRELADVTQIGSAVRAKLDSGPPSD
jgi:Domain of unknown function (DUF4062)